MDRLRLRTFLAAFAVLLFLLAGAGAADRVALIIGNGRYTKLRPLEACPRDAAKMAETFQRIGVRIHGGKPLLDLTVDQMDKALNDFVKTLGPGSEAFVYFSGHGAQIGGVNYLLPVGFDAEYESQARRQAVSLDTMLELLERTPSTLRVLILDACRDAGDLLPGEPALKSATRIKGLNEQKVDAPETLVCFATKHGTSALAGAVGSPYTDVLAEEIVKPGEIAAIMRIVARRVYESTDKRQLPFTYGSLLQDHFFARQTPALPPAVMPKVYDLKSFVLKAGQTFKVEEVMTMANADVAVTMQGQILKGTASINNRRVQISKVLAASNGQPTETETEFKEYTEKQTLNMGGQAKGDEKKVPLHGKTIISKRDNGRWFNRLKSGRPTPELTKALEKLGFEPDEMYEDRAVAVGTIWSVPPEKVAKLLGDAVSPSSTGTVQCRFDRVEVYNGRECAVISMDLKVNGRPPQPEMAETNVTIEISGIIIRSLEEKIDLKTDFNGTMRVDSPVPGSPGVRMQIFGPMSLKQTTTISK